jgi:hypothetical protein
MVPLAHPRACPTAAHPGSAGQACPHLHGLQPSSAACVVVRAACELRPVATTVEPLEKTQGGTMDLSARDAALRGTGLPRIRAVPSLEKHMLCRRLPWACGGAWSVRMECVDATLASKYLRTEVVLELVSFATCARAGVAWRVSLHVV